MDGVFEIAYMKLESVAGKIDKLESFISKRPIRKVGSWAVVFIELICSELSNFNFFIET